MRGHKLQMSGPTVLSNTVLLSCRHEADIRIRSHRFLDDNKSAASCQRD